MIKPSPLQVRSAVSVLVLAASTLVGLAVHEGYRDTAYIPVPGDVQTIGFGSTKGVKAGDKTNPVEALQRLYHEVDSVYVKALRNHVTVPLYPSELSAYTSWVYNFGEENLRTSAMLSYLNQGEYGKACGQIVRWVYAGGVALKGLQKRRIAEYLECVKDHVPDTQA